MEIDLLRIIEILVTVVGLFFAGLQVYFLSKQLRENNKWNKGNATILYCNAFDDIIEKVDNKLIEKLCLSSFDEASFQHSVFEELIKVENNEKDLSLLISYYEKLSAGIKRGYYDESIAKSMQYARFISHYVKLRPYIDILRYKSKLNVFRHYEILAEKWLSEKINYTI